MNKLSKILAEDLCSYDVIDSNLSLSEMNPGSAETVQEPNALEVDKFDNVSLQTPFITLDKKEILHQLEIACSNGMLWETDAANYSPNLEVEKTCYLEAINHIEDSTANTSLEKILAKFDSWVGTPLDIISPYGDIDYGRNIFTEGFSMEVPVKIYSEADDLIFKLDAPWMNIDTFRDVDLYPDKLNLKSVLALLPVTINSQELKASFVNGQFRLEVPKKELELNRERLRG